MASYSLCGSLIIAEKKPEATKFSLPGLTQIVISLIEIQSIIPFLNNQIIIVQRQPSDFYKMLKVL